MTSNRCRSRHDLGAFVLAGTLIFAAGCATPPESRDHAARDKAVPAQKCAELLAEIARTEQARSAAAEQSGNAWKAIVPVVVLAQKASSTAAVREADQRLAVLKVESQRCQTS